VRKLCMSPRGPVFYNITWVGGELGGPRRLRRQVFTSAFACHFLFEI